MFPYSIQAYAYHCSYTSKINYYVKFSYLKYGNRLQSLLTFKERLRMSEAHRSMFARELSVLNSPFGKESINRWIQRFRLSVHKSLAPDSCRTCLIKLLALFFSSTRRNGFWFGTATGIETMR